MVKSIGSGAFDGCEALKGIIVPASDGAIGEGAFMVKVKTVLTVKSGSYAEQNAIVCDWGLTPLHSIRIRQA